MVYTESEKKKMDRIGEVFKEHIQQSPVSELLWSDKVGYVWLAIGLEPLYADTCQRMENAEELCRECLDDIAADVLFLSGNDHGRHNADPHEKEEISAHWKPFMEQLPEYAYLCEELLSESESI